MIKFIILIILAILCILFVLINPYIDIFKDYRGKIHIILWYNYKNKRKYIDLRGSHDE